MTNLKRSFDPKRLLELRRRSANSPSCYSKLTTSNRKLATVAMGTRRKSRELVLQMLFQADMGKQTPEHVRDTFWVTRSDVDEEARGFAEDLFRVASDRLPEIDGLIGKHAQHWKMDRMAAVDRNVLRGAV